MTGAQGLIQGMQIIIKYDPSASVSAEHDVIWFGSSDTAESMSKEDQVTLEDTGWFIDTETDSWMTFV